MDPSALDRQPGRAVPTAGAEDEGPCVSGGAGQARGPDARERSRHRPS